MILERFCYSEYGTFGKLIVGDLTLYTVERPWKDNQAGISCIPEGEYMLEAHTSQKYPDTWALIGDTVSHYPEPDKARSAILFHVANEFTEVEGCIAPGMQLNGNKWGVVSSRKAMEALRKEIYATQTRLLKITQYRP